MVNSRLEKAEESTSECEDRSQIITPNVAQSNKEIENIPGIQRHAGQNEEVQDVSQESRRIELQRANV